MLFRKGYINKAGAGVLLIVLLLIHSVKLLHNHTPRQFSESHYDHVSFCEIGEESSAFSGDCTICNYQLTKDADYFTAVINNCPQYFLRPFSPPIFSAKSLFSFSSFETRGPPSVV